MKTIIEKIKSEWKEYSIYGSIAVVFLLIGMGMTEINPLKQILVNTISGLINQLPWFILIFVGFKMISTSIKTSSNKIVKNIPNWLTEYEKIKRRDRIVNKALGERI